ncbi:heme exporter protein CcmD [Leclercia sp. LSNIH6]|nr:heme exporter protein CcmD [Leclercia sp. LSNIH7]POU78764.1 heme exporter protein CcmD [Leclercia sp. LSNIH6]POW53735.1 heme exporter protein CcmD [Leclercia sp. LSNIH8]
MNSAFASWADFFAMGGYALYVWLSVAFTLGPLALLALESWRQHRRLMRAIAREQRREDHESTS